MEHEVQFKSDIQSLDQFHSWFDERLKSSVPDDENKHKQQMIITAVHEAYANVVRHAYASDDNGIIRIKLSCFDEKICVDIFDHGSSFDFDSVSEPDFSGDKFGGFGCYLVKKIATNTCYESSEEHGNRLHLEFKFDMIELMK